MAAITDDEALGRFPITLGDLAAWKSSGKLVPTMDPIRGELLDDHAIQLLVEQMRALEHDDIRRRVLGQLNVSGGPSTWEKINSYFSGIAAVAAALAIVVAGYQFSRTREALLADNEYRVWTDILQAAERLDTGSGADWSGLNDRVAAARAMHDAGNLTPAGWTTIVNRVCPKDLGTLDIVNGDVRDLKDVCRQRVAP